MKNCLVGVFAGVFAPSHVSRDRVAAMFRNLLVIGSMCSLLIIPAGCALPVVPGSGGGGGSGSLGLQYAVKFSGRDSPTDSLSAIDIIRAEAGKDFLYLCLIPGTETVDLKGAGMDITRDGEGGLVLDKSNSPTEVVIDGGGRVVQLGGQGKGALITIKDGIKLTLGNIVFKGITGNTKALIVVDGNEYTELLFENGAAVIGNENVTANGTGGGVSIIGGQFSMNAGTIRNNSVTGMGGGVYVGNGRFAINGGVINSNNALNGGGVGVAAGGSVVIVPVAWSIAFDENSEIINGNPMKGGTIWGNSATDLGGGVYVAEKGSFSKRRLDEKNDYSGIIYGLKKAANSTEDEDDTLKNVTGDRGAAVYFDGKPLEINHTLGPGDVIES